MASFVYNHYKSDKVFDLAESQKQWKDYLQEKEFHDDLTKSLKSEGESYRKELQRNAELASKDMNSLRQEFSQASEQQLEAIHEQTRAITESADMIVGSLDEGFANVNNNLNRGFSEVSGKLDSINSTIENLSTMLDWRLSKMIDQLRISNLLQENIALLLRVPDFQKERQYYIEQGFKHYKNAALDEDLYKDAIENLLEAEKREITDYVVLHRIGMIYLYAPELLDLAKAEDYFRRAAKYAIVESSPEAIQTLNLLAGNVGLRLDTQKTTPEAAKAVAAKAYFQAGISCYAQGKFAEAIELSGKAYSLLPSFLEAGFIQAKSLAVIGNGEKSAEILRGVIQAERFYSVKTISDLDLAPKNEVHIMLIQLRDDAIHKAKEKLSKVKKELANNSQITPFIPSIENFIEKGNYFDALQALDELTVKRDWDRPSRYLFDESSQIDKLFLEHESKVEFTLFSPDNSLIVTHTHNRALRIWDANSGELVKLLKPISEQEIPRNENSYFQASFLPDNQLAFKDTSSHLDRIQIWDIISGKVLNEFLEDKNWNGSFESFSSDGSKFFTTMSWSNEIIVLFWETKTCRLMKEIKAKANDYDKLFRPFAIVSPDAAFVAIRNDLANEANYRRDPIEIQIFDVESGNQIHKFPHHDIFGRIYSRNSVTKEYKRKIEFSPNNTFLAIQREENQIQLLDLLTCKEVGFFHKNLPICFSNNSNLIFVEESCYCSTFSEQGNQFYEKYFSVSASDYTKYASTHDQPLYSRYNRSFSPDDSLFAAQKDSWNEKDKRAEISVSLWSVGERKLINDIQINNNVGIEERNSLLPVLFSPNGKKFALIHGGNYAFICGGNTSLSIEEFVEVEREDLKQKAEKEESSRRKKEKDTKRKAELEREQMEAKQKKDESIRLLQQARNECAIQDKKWMFKDYSKAISLYEQAQKLGNLYTAKFELKKLKEKLGLS